MATKGKKRFSKYDFSDEEIYNNIKDDIRDIKDMNLKQVDEEFRIMNLYEEKKK